MAGWPGTDQGVAPTMTQQAYALREGYEDTFEGGSFASGPLAETVDVKDLLLKGDGTILTEDPNLQQYLNDSPAFKHVAAKEAEAPVVGEGGDVHVAEVVDPDRLSKDDLLAIADDEIDGHEFDQHSRKGDIARAINDQRTGGEG